MLLKISHIHLSTSQIFTEHLLCSRHHSRYWAFCKEINRHQSWPQTSSIQWLLYQAAFLFGFQNSSVFHSWRRKMNQEKTSTNTCLLRQSFIKKTAIHLYLKQYFVFIRSNISIAAIWRKRKCNCKKQLQKNSSNYLI